MKSDNESLHPGLRFGRIGLAAATGLVALDLTGAFLSGSRALLAAALYSILSVISAAVVLSRVDGSQKSADQDYPYGRGKIEFLAVSFVSMVVAVFGFLLLYRVAGDLLAGSHQVVGAIMAVTAGISCITSLAISRYAQETGDALCSREISSNVQHHQAGLVAFVAILAAALLMGMGLGWTDLLVAVCVVLYVFYASWKSARAAVDGILDATVDAETTGEITQVAKVVPGIVGVEHVRARSVGASLWVDVCVRVGPKRRMSEVGHIRALVRQQVLSKIDHVTNVIVEVLPAVRVEGIAPDSRIESHS